MMTRCSLIEINAMARKVDVDSRIPLHYYYRIADSLLKQASIYREEKNVVDLYVMLLRYSSLVFETIPLHRDYQDSLSKQRVFYRKKLVGVLDELEKLKPEVQRRADELNQFRGRDQQPINGSKKTSTELAAIHWRPSSTQQQTGTNPQSLWTGNTMQVGNQFKNLSISLPLPKKETLSRHSFLGSTGLRGQWQGPTSAPKVQYPSYSELAATENFGLSQVEQPSLLSEKDSEIGGNRNTMESVLALDDGRWSSPAEESIRYFNNGASEDRFLLGNIRQPSPPPVLAKINQEYSQISPSRVADPRPGPAKHSKDDVTSSSEYQHLHIPVKIMDDFLRLARESTAKNLETCGILAGSLKNRVFYITTLIIPKQESTSDSCQTLNEEEIFEVQDKRSLFPLGWIHTHPSQTCFMSSVDLHTHYSYQIMLPEAIAIVMAPTDTSSPHGIFHLSDPSGVSVIRNCQERGFHPHEEPLDGNPIYEHCSHVYMNPNMKFDVLDLR